MLSMIASVDLYRKVPADLLEGTVRGKILSVLAVVAMATLFLYETIDFWSSTELITELSLDSDSMGGDKRIRVSFNITMFDLQCDWAVLDTVSIYGTEQNVSQNVVKWQVDAEGMRQRFSGRNKFQRDIILHDPSVEDVIEDLHEDGEDAVSLDVELFELALQENQFLFVDFYASWCSHCHDFMPTWEVLAEIMSEVADYSVQGHFDGLEGEEGDEFYIPPEELELAKKIHVPVLIAKVDCEEHFDLCAEHAIRAYPTLRLFVDGKRYGADYHDDRTLEALTNYLATIEHDISKAEGVLTDVERLARTRLNKPTDHQWRKKRHLQPHWKDQDHLGCQLSGYLSLDCVPGSFQIMARSSAHDFDPRSTNLSHQIHSLYFGNTWQFITFQIPGHNIPNHLSSKLSPLDGNVYITHHLHQAYHHHLKIVPHSFQYKAHNNKGKQNTAKVYQPLSQSQLSNYQYDAIPEAKFVYDLSPVAIHHLRSSPRRWYDYLTSLMAIIGGTFTVLGMVESSIQRIAPKKHL